MNPAISEITGGAGPEETAAIAAVIASLIDEEQSAASRPALAPRQSGWVLSWRPRELPPPLPSHIYDAESWGEDENGEEFEQGA